MSPKNKSNQRTLVLIDYANLKAATRYLGKKIDLKILYEHFKKDVSIKEVSLYYGTDPRDPRSYGFITWLRKTGYDVVTKEVKYIKINLKDLIYNSQTNRIF